MPSADIDWVLATMLDGASVSGEALPLTVFCGGHAVSGTAVSEETYFRKVGLTMLEEGAPQSRDARIQELATASAALGSEDVSAEDRQALLTRIDDLARRFIMMVDVTILGVGPDPIRAPAWRGRLSQVSGWIPGVPNTP